MGSTTLLSELGTEILIPICAVIGIVFSLFQWYLVSQVKVSVDKSSSSGDDKNGFTESLIEEEEGVNDHTVVQKCAEIQQAISEDRNEDDEGEWEGMVWECVEIVGVRIYREDFNDMV
nr:pyrophosphate-energized vacuolar membrane proton pump-like [Tanacetum cinerariifolium]